MTDTTAPRAVKLCEIDASALPRDRTALDETALAELATSIALSGLRQPIEVFESQPGPGILPYGLISGLRRLTAMRRLAAGDPDATVPAFVRTPRDAAHAMAEMVAENEIRADLTPWERGRIVVEARDAGIFDTLDAATAGLFPALDRNRRTRVRAIAGVVDELGDGLLTDPRALSQNQILRLATALGHGLYPVIEHALRTARDTSPDAQWRILQPIVAEAEEDTSTADAAHPHLRARPDRPGRPRRLVHVRRALTIRRERLPEGWSLRFTGPDATGPLMDDIMDEVERLYGRED